MYNICSQANKNIERNPINVTFNFDFSSNFFISFISMLFPIFLNQCCCKHTDFTQLLDRKLLFSQTYDFIGIKYTSNGPGTVRVGDGSSTMNNAVSICITSLMVPAQIYDDGKSLKVTEIGGWAFYNCDSLTSVTIGANVVTIGEYAFSDCDSLTSISFEKDSALETIGTRAFSWCSLKQIEIPPSVKKIGDNAFNSRGILKMFVYCGLNEITNKIFCKLPPSVFVSEYYNSSTYGNVPVYTNVNYCS